jgi:phosphoribosylaminoimidazolecarboxamide formyltransferase/IMP cyclohydrolase
MSTLSRALVSVYDKRGIIEFARALHAAGIELISTGGTARALAEAGLPVTPIDAVTGFPEMLDGRVKTLHPKVHGGLLAVRENPDHMAAIAAHGIERIDMVVVNLYPFEATVASGASRAECIEQIDIGGPSMLRSAAKNHAAVTVVCDPTDYERVLEEIRTHGDTLQETRAQLAAKVFATTASYDAAIGSYLAGGGEETLPPVLGVNAVKVQDLRYGENPHQSAALYGGFFDVFEKLHGKELSFNNIVDIQAAAMLAEEFDGPAAAIIKHTNPCGCAVADDLVQAYLDALATDPVSAFGGIMAFNREIDARLAEKLNEIFCEVLIAPSYSAEALALLEKKRDRRLLVQRAPVRPTVRLDVKTIANGYLCQSVDNPVEDSSTWKVVTRRAPSVEEHAALSFAWKVAKHVKSNAIVYVRGTRTLGVGAGQMSRVDSSAIAVSKAQKAELDLSGSVMASDAFFPFADGLIEAVRAGATAVVQPGGSVRDQEVIDAADEHGIAMLFTGIRHFKH